MTDKTDSKRMLLLDGLSVMLRRVRQMGLVPELTGRHFLAHSNNRKPFHHTDLEGPSAGRTKALIRTAKCEAVDRLKRPRLKLSQQIEG